MIKERISVYIYFKRIIYLWIILHSSVFSFEMLWDGKWDVYSKYGAFILILEQNENNITGTYSPGDGTLSGYIKDNQLHASLKDVEGGKPLLLLWDKMGMRFLVTVSKVTGWLDQE